jgi:putative ABC transport system permease protein
MGSFGSEIFRTVRGLLRSPGFTVLAVLALALGIGANTVIFSIVNAVLLRPYPYQDPDRLVRINGMDTSRNELEMDASMADFVDLRGQAPAFAGIAAVDPGTFSLMVGTRPVRIQGARASANLFSVLGVKAALGRVFLAGEDRPGGERLLLLSHGLWQRSFGSDPKVVGRAVRLDGEPRTIVGVLEANAEYPDTAEAWVPLAIDPAQAPRDQRTLTLLGRLAPDATLARASGQAGEVAHRLAAAYPTTNERYGLRAISLLESRVGRYRQLIGILMAVVGFVLLLACANVANLLLQRAVTREREMVLRIVLGAGRLRLMRLMLVETMILALLGAVLGLAVTRWLLGVVVSAIPFPLPPYIRFDLSPPVLVFALATALLVAALLGLLPAG